MPSSIASSTTPTGSISPATACDARAPAGPPTIDRLPNSMPQIIRQRGTGPRATSCRNTGRHHLGMPGRLRRNPQAIANPTHERHRELKEWFADDFNPHIVDVDWLSEDVAELAQPSRQPAVKRRRTG